MGQESGDNMETFNLFVHLNIVRKSTGNQWTSWEHIESWVSACMYRHIYVCTCIPPAWKVRWSIIWPTRGEIKLLVFTVKTTATDKLGLVNWFAGPGRLSETPRDVHGKCAALISRQMNNGIRNLHQQIWRIHPLPLIRQLYISTTRLWEFLMARWC